jgi:hypothetical protein
VVRRVQIARLTMRAALEALKLAGHRFREEKFPASLGDWPFEIVAWMTMPALRPLLENSCLALDWVVAQPRAHYSKTPGDRT